MVIPSPSSKELEELQGLMRDFPVPRNTFADQPHLAWNEIQDIYLILEDYGFDDIIGFNDIFTYPTTELEQQLIKLILKIHQALFSRFMSCAGQFRKTTDPNQGTVLFGPNQRFRGVVPHLIADEVKKSISHLVFKVNHQDEAFKKALQFYQHFVWTHPFYDGNGRIARLIVNAYLNQYKQFIDWGQITKHPGKFLNKLNQVHKQMDSKFEYDTYLNYLVNYLIKFKHDFDF